MTAAPQWVIRLKRRFASTGFKHSSSSGVERCYFAGVLLLYATFHIALMVVVVKWKSRVDPDADGTRLPAGCGWRAGAFVLLNGAYSMMDLFWLSRDHQYAELPSPWRHDDPGAADVAWHAASRSFVLGSVLVPVMYGPFWFFCCESPVLWWISQLLPPAPPSPRHSVAYIPPPSISHLPPRRHTLTRPWPTRRLTDSTDPEFQVEFWLVVVPIIALECVRAALSSLVDGFTLRYILELERAFEERLLRGSMCLLEAKKDYAGIVKLRGKFAAVMSPRETFYIIFVMAFEVVLIYDCTATPYLSLALSLSLSLSPPTPSFLAMSLLQLSRRVHVFTMTSHVCSLHRPGGHREGGLTRSLKPKQKRTLQHLTRCRCDYPAPQPSC